MMDKQYLNCIEESKLSLNDVVNELNEMEHSLINPRKCIALKIASKAVIAMKEIKSADDLNYVVEVLTDFVSTVD